MLNPNENSKPAASWGAVAKEAVKHPWQNGLVDLTFGTLSVVEGVIARDPILITCGVGLDTFGAMRFNRLAKKTRYPTNSLH